MNLSPSSQLLLSQLYNTTQQLQEFPQAISMVISPFQNDKLKNIKEEIKHFFETEAYDVPFEVVEEEIFEWKGGTESLFAHDCLFHLTMSEKSFVMFTTVSEPNRIPVLNYPRTLQ